MRTGIIFEVSPSDRRRLERVVRDRKAAQKHVWRASIILLSADGVGTAAIMRHNHQVSALVSYQIEKGAPSMDGLHILQWMASGTGMVAAILVAWNAGSKVSGIGFVIFSLSSVLWISASIIDGNNPLAIQNIVLFFINLFGIHRYLWRSNNSAGKATS